MSTPEPERAGAGTWLELAVVADFEAVEPIVELLARYGYQEGVVIEETYRQDPDGDNLEVDPSKPVTVRTYLPKAGLIENSIEKIERGLWHLGRMRRVDNLTVTERQEEDWANAWKAHFKPVKVGRRVVACPSWENYESQEGEIVVILDPGMAFGTGVHPSTKLAMRGLEAALRPGDSVADIGTGSGILALAAVKLGAGRVCATDIEKLAVHVAAGNAELNDLSGEIDFAVGGADVVSTDQGLFRVVVANIIARVLVEHAADIAHLVGEDGMLVLSGIIESREPTVVRTYDEHGFKVVEREQIEDWVGLTLARP